jgi:hypothetical protein
MQAQHHSKMVVELNSSTKTIRTQQEITFLINRHFDDCFKRLNNAYSNKNTPLAKRFSDEFYRGFIWQKRKNEEVLLISLFWIQ